ncbi:MAG: endolytic transglycosylase MltG [Chloroflexi bacterium]|nr:endolytic transglycosylase MltG [Chloroflexota bacterium]
MSPAPSRSPVAYRRPPPQKRSMVGPLVFVLLVLAIVVGVASQGQSVLADAVYSIASDRDTLLRQGPIRAVVAARLGAQTDLAADPSGVMRDFEVSKGQTASDVARRLEEEKLVRSRLALLVVLYDIGKESEIQAGSHRLSAAMTPREIAEVLVTKAPEEQVRLRLIEGWRLTEIATEISKVFPKITKDAFLQAAVVGKRTSPAVAGLDPVTSLEGFLFPDTYFFKPDATAEQIIDRLLLTFDEKAGTMLRSAAAEQKRTVYDLVKLASLVEREARDRKESAQIAGVYANRLRIGMKLDADPTIQYALGVWRPLLLDDLKLESPYNTYRVAGLPPTPIASPGLLALEGAARPARHDFLFFVASEATGQHLFARTLEEHEANRVKVGNR